MKIRKGIVKLSPTDILKKGDVPIYADGTVGKRICKDEIGLTVGESGYYAVGRKK